MPPNGRKREAAIDAAEAEGIRKKLREHSTSQHQDNELAPLAHLEEWNAVQRQQLNASRQERVAQMIHPSRARHTLSLNSSGHTIGGHGLSTSSDVHVGGPESRIRATPGDEKLIAREKEQLARAAAENASRKRQQKRQQQRLPVRRPPSTRVAAHEARKTIRMKRSRGSKNRHVHYNHGHHAQEVVERRDVVAPPISISRDATQKGNAKYLKNPVPEASRLHHSTVTSTVAHAAGAIGSDSSSSWSESSVGGRAMNVAARGMNVSQPYRSTVAPRATAAAPDEQDIGNELDSLQSSSELDKKTTAQSRQRMTSGEPLWQSRKKSKKQHQKDLEKRKLLKNGINDCCKNSKLVPHPNLLQRFVCTNCSMYTGHQKSVTYNWQRKAYNKRHDLVKVVAQPDQPTLDLIKSIQDKIHVPLDFRPNHIVLAESMTREKASDMVNDINGISIHGLRFVVSKAVDFEEQVGARKHRIICLILVATDTRLKLALERAREQHCVLPQWPLSLVLGSYTGARIVSVVRTALNDGRVLPTLVFDSLAILDSSGQPTDVQEDTKIKSEVEPAAGQTAEANTQPEPAVDSEESAQLNKNPGVSPAAEHTQCHECTYIPHPSERDAVVCCECGKEKSARGDIVWFNDLRRGFLRDRHSLQISAKLDERSRALIEPLRIADAASSTSYEMITLVDGLMEWSIQSTSLLNDIQHAIHLTPALQIVGSHFIPTSDSETTGLQLLVIDLRPEPALARVLFEAAQSSLVAQSPLRVSIGMVPSRGASDAITDIVKSLVGSSLFLDPGSVASQSAFLL